MDFKSEKFGEVAVIHVYLNRATLAKAIAFKDFTQSIIDEGYSKLIIDLSMSEYLDSTFLGAMVSLLKKVSVLNGDLRLVYKKEMPSLHSATDGEFVADFLNISQTEGIRAHVFNVAGEYIPVRIRAGRRTRYQSRSFDCSVINDHEAESDYTVISAVPGKRARKIFNIGKPLRG